MSWRAINRKAKGINGERDIVHLFWKAGWAASRVAGSGAVSFPAPDVIAGNNIRKVVIEAKVTSSASKYFSKKEIEDLIEFARIFGAEPWVSIKFPQSDWLFLNPEDLKATPLGFSVSIRRAKALGLLFEEFIRTP